VRNLWGRLGVPDARGHRFLILSGVARVVLAVIHDLACDQRRGPRLILL